MSQENVELVKRAYELLNLHGTDPASLTEADFSGVFAPGLEIVQTAAIPDTAGTFVGYAGLLQGRREVLAVMDEVQFHAERHVDSGDAVVSLVRVSGIGRSSGVPVEVEVAHQWAFGNGRIVRWIVHADPADALAAAGLVD